MRLIEMLTALVCALHLFTCAFWRVKIESSPQEEVDRWLIKNSVDPSFEVSRRHAITPPPDLSLKAQRHRAGFLVYISLLSVRGWAQVRGPDT